MRFDVIRQSITEALEFRSVRMLLGFGLATTLPISIVLVCVVADSVFGRNEPPFDGALIFAVTTVGLFMGLAPTVVLGIPLYVIRRNLGVLALPVVLIAAAVGGVVMTRVERSGHLQWSDYAVGALFSVPSALAFWWFVMRSMGRNQQLDNAFQPTDSDVTAVARQQPRHPAG